MIPIGTQVTITINGESAFGLIHAYYPEDGEYQVDVPEWNRIITVPDADITTGGR